MNFADGSMLISTRMSSDSSDYRCLKGRNAVGCFWFMVYKFLVCSAEIKRKTLDDEENNNKRNF